MKYIKRILIYLKQRKKLTFFILIFGIFTLNFKTITNKIHRYHTNGYDGQSGELATLINSVIGIPYLQKPQYMNDSPDIIKISKDEWFALPYYPKSTNIVSVRDDLNLVESMPSKEEAMHALSLRLSPMRRAVGTNTAIFDKLCGYFLTCESLNISVQEYVYFRPELLKNIIKIAERPCDYIKILGEVQPEGEMLFSTSFFYEFYTKKFDQEDIKYAIKLARKDLNCDQKGWLNLPNRLYFKFPSLFYSSLCKRKYVLLTINKEGIYRGKPEPSLDIIIERKDIN